MSSSTQPASIRSRHPFRFVLLVLSFLIFVSPGQTAETIRSVGAASIDITPDYPVRLSGYGSRTQPHTGVAQKIYAKALAIGTDAEGPAVLVTVDNCGVPAFMRQEVLNRLAAKNHAIKNERFAVMSTHTHCAPMLPGILQNLFGTNIPPEHLPAIERYGRDLTERLEQVVLNALADRKPSTLAWGIGRTGFATNRRGYRLKPVDHDLPVLRVLSPSGEVRAIFTSYACHCTTLAIDSIHGDWAGCAQEALQREFPGAIALTALGCGADQNPEPRRTIELATKYGESVATEAGRLVRSRLETINGSLDCRIRQIDLAFDTLPTRAEWEALAQSKTAAIAYHARKNLDRLNRGEALPTTLPYLVQSWSFGEELTMVFLAGEVVVDYSLRLKREFDHRRIWVNAYANDVPCYIPSRRILEEGGYEGAGAMVYYDRPTRFARDVEDRIFRTVYEIVPTSFLASAKPDPMRLPPEAIPYPDHSKLLVLRDASGTERAITSTNDWKQRVNHIRANMQQAMGPLPDASRWAPLEMELVSERDMGTYLRRKIRFTPEPGDRVPAWLLIPKNILAGGKAPAMLCLHQTTGIGKDEPAGLGGLKSLHYALELVERGYLCIVPDYPSFGEYPYNFKTTGAHHASGSIKAVWNNQRAVDLLESLPMVNRDRIGVIGHSLGGHNALFTAALDDRLKAVVSSCGFTPFHDYYGGKVAGWTSDRYMPRIREVYGNDAGKIPFDFYEILGSLAPRGFFSNSPVNDSNFDVNGVRKAFAQARQVYEMHGAPQRLQLATPDAPHDFPEAERRAAYEWLDRLLK